MRSRVKSGLAVLLALGVHLAAEPALAELPSALTCTYAEGGAWAFEKQAFAAKPVEGLSFVIADIDRNTMTARLDRKEGLVVLRMVQAVDAHHFIEVGVEGFLNLTTVYEVQADGSFPAVHSRHVAVLGEPLVSQYRGVCRAK